MWFYRTPTHRPFGPPPTLNTVESAVTSLPYPLTSLPNAEVMIGNSVLEPEATHNQTLPTVTMMSLLAMLPHWWIWSFGRHHYQCLPFFTKVLIWVWSWPTQPLPPPVSGHTHRHRHTWRVDLCGYRMTRVVHYKTEWVEWVAWASVTHGRHGRHSQGLSTRFEQEMNHSGFEIFFFWFEMGRGYRNHQVVDKIPRATKSKTANFSHTV